MTDPTYFGYERVTPDEKTRRVRGVFDSVADKYDLMNDLMSAGLHRGWKRFTVEVAGVRPGARVLDLAGGTGDLARLFAERAGPAGTVVHTDINGAMLVAGRDKLIDRGVVLPTVQCDAEALPFADRSFDCVSIGFGLRNVTHKERALAEMARVLAPGGIAVVLEFSRMSGPARAALRLVQLQRAARARAARRQRRGELPLSRRIDSRASRPGGTEDDDGTIGLRSRRLLQPGRRRRGAARRTRILRAGIEARLYPPKCGRRLTRAAIARI